jgi:hypothetical protein
VVTPARQQPGAEHLDQALGIAEHQALVAPVQLRGDLGRVLDGSHVIKLDDLLRLVLDYPERAVADRPAPPPRFRDDDHARPLSDRRSLEPAQQFLRVADGGGQPDPLHRMPAEPGQPFQDRQQMPSPVAGPERVDLVHDDGLQAGEQPVVIDVDADQHRLERLGRGEQEIGRVSQHGRPV